VTSTSAFGRNGGEDVSPSRRPYTVQYGGVGETKGPPLPLGTSQGRRRRERDRFMGTERRKQYVCLVKTQVSPSHPCPRCCSVPPPDGGVKAGADGILRKPQLAAGPERIVHSHDRALLKVKPITLAYAAHNRLHNNQVVHIAMR
jgi:hypothetical protein